MSVATEESWQIRCVCHGADNRCMKQVDQRADMIASMVPDCRRAVWRIHASNGKKRAAEDEIAPRSSRWRLGRGWLTPNANCEVRLADCRLRFAVCGLHDGTPEVGGTVMRCRLQNIRHPSDSAKADAETQTHNSITSGGADSIWKLGICGGRDGESRVPRGMRGR